MTCCVDTQRFFFYVLSIHRLLGELTAEPIRFSRFEAESHWINLIQAGKSKFITVQIGLAQFKADPLIKPVSGFARGARGQIDGFSAELSRVFESCKGQRFANALAPLGGVHHDILDPRADARGDAERDQGQRADNLAVLLRITSNQQRIVVSNFL